jgi:hypothetical protein
VDSIRAVQARINQIQSFARSLNGGGPASATKVELGAFAGTLAAATALDPSAPMRSTGALTPADRKAPGQYGRLEPPAALVQYGNGRVPAQALTPLGVGDHRLFRPAAEAFVRMRADASAAGVTIGVEDSYRSYDEQVSLAARKGLYSQGGLAARPGSSNHGWGVALDLDLDAAAQRWMRENGWRYGFVEDVAREPWHWTYRPADA